MSSKQPFCDGKHVAYNKENATDFKPLPYVSAEAAEVFFCRCKQSMDGALCDGSHSAIKTKVSRD
jgi:CDGSH-type Zn-finger protein